jgi:hypothetical protein
VYYGFKVTDIIAIGGGGSDSGNKYDDNPFRYSGECFDSETGNYYLRARYITLW